ncbi:opticin [Lampris incognitus]|uniref:opticin n=1 Tax=Lampris incognitus TaxID=2546036 RepID=UPI0024B5FBA7|nr:opticin [Lampris incognitus]
MCDMRMSLQPQVFAVALVLIFSSPYSSMGSPQGGPGFDDGIFDLENYDDWDSLDLNGFGDNYDYDDLDGEIEVGMVVQPTPEPANTANEHLAEFKMEVTPPPAPVTLDFKGPDLFGPETSLGMPTCLLCVCISGSIYCDDSNLEQIPPLPKDTTHFYARFNKIRHVKNTDFINLNKLKYIDLTANQIAGMDEDVFHNLPHLQDLILANNQLQALPELPINVRYIDVRSNKLISAGIHPDAFKDLSQLEFLYLSKNHLHSIPAPLPDSLRVLHLQNNDIQSLHEDTFCNRHDRNYIRRNLEDIRLDANPLNINLFAHAYVCLLRLPVGGR